MPDELRGSTPQKQEPCRGARSVRQNPQNGKQAGQPLNFIHDDEAAQRRKRGYRFGKARERDGILEVELVRVRTARQASCQRGLPALAGTKQRHDRVCSQR